MKRLLLIAGIFISIMNYSFAESGNFEQTYTKLIDEITVQLPTLNSGNALNSSGRSTISINLDAGDNNKWSLKLLIDYDSVTSTSKRWTSMEMKLNINSTLHGSIEWQNINNLNMIVDGQLRIAPGVMYFKLDNFSVDTSQFPLEFQWYADMIVWYIKSGVIGKRIRVVLPKEIAQSLKQSTNTISPQTIIAALKQYPLIKNTEYKDHMFFVSLHKENIIKIINHISKLQWSEEMISSTEQTMIVQQLDQTHIQWTLTDTDSPRLILTTQETIDQKVASGTVSIWSKQLIIQGTVQDEEWQAGLSLSIEHTAPSRYDYSLQFNITAPNQPLLFDMTMKWYESIGILTNYTFSRPKRSLTMRQLEKKIEKDMQTLRQ